MAGKTIKLEDIAEAIIDLGTLMSDQVTELRHELLGEITGVRDNLSDEVMSLRSNLNDEIASSRSEMNKRFYRVDAAQRETNTKLTSLENESKAVRNDIKELYDLTAT